MDVSCAALRMPDPMPIRSLSPPPVAPETIRREQTLTDVFCAETEKTLRTFWVEIIFNGSLFVLECKPNLNQQSAFADRMRRLVGKNPIWIPCTLSLKKDEASLALPTAVFIKRTAIFTPQSHLTYHLPPPVFIEGSGNEFESAKFFRNAYQLFQGLHRPSHSRRITTTPIKSEADSKKTCFLLTWSTTEFVIDLDKRLGRGTTKSVSLALRVQIIHPYHFRVSKRALIRPLPGFEKAINFQFPELERLSHPNIGIPDPEEIRYRIIDGETRQWCRLTYLGTDLEKAAASISSESSLYSIFFQMIAGVNYLLKNGYMHDDLKPANWIVYRNEGRDSIVRLEDCESILELKIGLTKRRPLQPFCYLPIHLRKCFLDVISEKSLVETTPTKRKLLQKTYQFEHEELAEASANVLGYSIAQIYLVFRQSRHIPISNACLIESLIGKLSTHPIRNSDEILPFDMSRYLYLIDVKLRKDSSETIAKNLKQIPSLDLIAEHLCKLYHTAKAGSVYSTST